MSGICGMRRKFVTVEASKLRWLINMKGWEKTNSSLRRTERIVLEFEREIDRAYGKKGGKNNRAKEAKEYGTEKQSKQ